MILNLEQTLTNLKDAGLYRELLDIDTLSGQYLIIDGKRYINFTSNDYLGLGQMDFDPDELGAFLNQYGHHLSSSRLISGNSQVYSTLETQISDYFGFEESVIFNSGYDANLAVFNSFKGENILVFSDQHNHASLIDGMKLSGTEKLVYTHLDYDELEDHLALCHTLDIPKMIVSDSVFSTDGSMIDLARLIELKQKYDAWLVIDDSHGLGLNLIKDDSNIDILTSSLSKAWGAHGGIVLCSSSIKQLIINKGRSLIYTSGLPMHQLYFIQKQFDALRQADTNRVTLAELSAYFNTQLATHFPSQSRSISPIKNIVFEDLHTAATVHQQLFQRGFFVSYLRYPTVQQPTLRISLSSFHHQDAIDALFNALTAIIKEVNDV